MNIEEWWDWKKKILFVAKTLSTEDIVVTLLIAIILSIYKNVLRDTCFHGILTNH